MTVAHRPAAPRRRDATATRALLLDAACRRFTVDGYTTTTVRQIADDVGVNVALINRYFVSKEGLFEACLAQAAAVLGRAPARPRRSGIAEAIAGQAMGHGPPGGSPNALLLVLRSSGDPTAEQMRLAMLRRFSERIASAAGWAPGSEDDTDSSTDDDRLLRAQVVLAAAAGIAVLRTGRLEPLVTARSEALLAIVADLVDGVLGPETPGPVVEEPVEGPA